MNEPEPAAIRPDDIRNWPHYQVVRLALDICQEGLPNQKKPMSRRIGCNFLKDLEVPRGCNWNLQNSSRNILSNLNVRKGEQLRTSQGRPPEERDQRTLLTPCSIKR